MKKTLIALLLLVASAIFFSRCYLNRYIFSDQEIADHYYGKKTKPEFRTLPFLDRNLHYAVMGKNDSLPLLVMVHGAPGAWYGYLNLIDDSVLQKNFRIISVDRLGYGKSGAGKEVLSVQMQALAIKSIIEKENHTGEKVYLLGRSYGAPIAAWLAINYPQKIEKLVMASPVIDPEHEKFYWFSDIGHSSMVQWMLPDLLNVATSEKFAHQQEMRLMENSWDKLYTPTYVVVGEDDNVADTANYSFACRKLVNCPAVFMKLQQTGHQITQKQPALIRDLLLGNAHAVRPSTVYQGAKISQVYDNREDSRQLSAQAAPEAPEVNLR